MLFPVSLETSIAFLCGAPCFLYLHCALTSFINRKTVLGLFFLFFFFKETNYFVFFLNILFIYFYREGNGRRKRGKETSITYLPYIPPPGTKPATQPCVLTGNQTSDLFVCRPALNPLNHTSQGLSLDFSCTSQSQKYL